MLLNYPAVVSLGNRRTLAGRVTSGLSSRANCKEMRFSQPAACPTGGALCAVSGQFGRLIVRLFVSRNSVAFLRKPPAANDPALLKVNPRGAKGHFLSVVALCMVVGAPTLLFTEYQNGGALKTLVDYAVKLAIKA